ncbi:MAG: hypothetical protein F6J86_16810 [Symploca sp. SIO1B1]|nr:hypothetical protein [Symploca sp. SIO1B1]
MDRFSVEQSAVINRISKTLNNLVESKSILQELDQVELTQHFSSQLLKNWSPAQVMSIPEDELQKIIQAVMLFKILYDLLEDLNLEEMGIFDAALSGK